MAAEGNPEVAGFERRIAGYSGCDDYSAAFVKSASIDESDDSEEDNSIRNAEISRQNNVVQLELNDGVHDANDGTQAAKTSLTTEQTTGKLRIVIDSPKTVASQTGPALEVEEPQKNGGTTKPVPMKTSADLNANVAPAHQRAPSSLSKADMFFLGDDEDYEVHAANDTSAQEIKAHVGQQLKNSPLLQSASDGCRVAVGNFAGQVARQVATNAINSDLRNPMKRRGNFNRDTVTLAADRALKETLQALKDINGLKSVKVSQEQVEALKQQAVRSVEGLMWKTDPRHCSAEVRARCAMLVQLPTPEEVARSVSLYTIANSIHKDGLKETLIPAEDFSTRRREIVNQVVLDADAYMHRMYQTWEENAIERTVATLNQTLVPAMNRTPMQWLADGTDKMELLDQRLYD